METHFLSLIEDKNSTPETSSIKENSVKSEFALMCDQILAEDGGYPSEVEKNLTNFVDDAIVIEGHDETTQNKSRNSTQYVPSSEESTSSLNLATSTQSHFTIICLTCLKSCPADIIEAHADECAEEHKSLNILFNSSFGSLDNDESEDIVFESHSNVKTPSMSVPENPEHCREMLQNAMVSCGVDIKKTPISITVFRGSCFNDFYKHFRKPWIAKLDPCCRYEVKFAGEDAIDEGGVSREFYTGMEA